MKTDRHWTVEIERWPAAFVVWGVFVALTCLANLGGFGVMGMEGMVVDGGRTMLAGGSWVVPEVYGEMYTYKPALAYWLSAAAQALPGPANEWILRLPFALCAVALSLVVFVVLGRRVTPRVGLFAALAVTGTPLLLEKVRVAEFDTPLAFGVGTAVVCATANLAARRPHLGLWLLAYLGLSVGFLAKGTPALMAFAPGLILAAVFTRNLPALFSWRHLLAASLFALVVGVYLRQAYLVGGWSVFEHPLREAQMRSGGWDLSSFSITLAKPLVVLASFLPWSVCLLLAGGAVASGDQVRQRMGRAAAAFLGAGLVPFVLVPTNESRYYLPLVTAHAILVALSLDALLERPVPRAAMVGLRGLLLVLAAAGMAAAVWLMVPLWPGVILACGLLGTFAIPVPRRPGRSVATLLVATSLVLAVAQAFVLIPRRASSREQSANAEVLRSYLPPGETVWVRTPADAAGKHSSLYYYLDHPVRTFSDHRAPPEGAYIVAPSPRPVPTVPDSHQQGSAVEDQALEVAVVPHRGGEFRLVRPGPALGH